MASAMAYACVICQERFTRNDISAIKCGHTFHLQCIMQWLQVNKSCPKCRTKIAEKDVISHLFFDNAADDSSAVCSDSPEFLKFEISSLKSDISDMSKQLETVKNKLKTAESDSERQAVLLISLSDKNSQKDEVISTLKKQIIFLQPYQKKFESAEKEIDSLKTQLSTYRKIDVMNNGSTEEADLMLEGILTSSNCVESMRVFMINLKKSYNDVCTKKSKLAAANMKVTKEMEELKKENKELKEKLHFAREELKIRNVGAISTPCNPHVKSLLKDSPFDVSDIPTVPPLDFNDPLTPIYGNTGSRFRFKEFKDVTNEQQDSRMPNFDKMMPKASTSNLKPVIEEEVERLLEPSSGSGLNVPAGISKKVATTAANPQLHFQKQSKPVSRSYLNEIEAFNKFDGLGGHVKVSNVPKKPTFTLGPSAAAGKRSNTAVISNKGLKRLKSSNDVPRPFAFAPIRPSSAANKLQGVDAEIIDISG